MMLNFVQTLLNLFGERVELIVMSHIQFQNVQTVLRTLHVFFLQLSETIVGHFL